jgi:DNA-binding response OmpR family regulator
MDGSFILKVKDTGIGIAKADLTQVFDRFFQSDASSTRQGEGTGIGLTLTRELVTLMEGWISVKSHQGKGAEFEVKLPINNAANVKAELGDVSVASDTVSPKKSVLSEVGYFPDVKEGILLEKGNGKEKPLVLIADDNADVRTYLAACLNKDYKLALAKNGQECEEVALEIIPDLIVLDVMMPLKNGYDTCTSLKTDERTSHIPIIMLTAKADMDSKLEGLQQGADDYLTKPFHKQELLLRIRNLLELRRQLQQYYRSLLESDGSSSNTTERSGLSKETQKTDGHVTPKGLQSDGQSIPLTGSSDNAFVMKVRKSVETHLDDPQFKVAVLCRSLALSHSQVHRKLSALTGLSATHFIRYVRLLKAKELLRDSGFSIAAIASDCGFSDPAYFSRVFKQEFGVSPQVWQEENAARD